MQNHSRNLKQVHPSTCVLVFPVSLEHPVPTPQPPLLSLKNSLGPEPRGWPIFLLGQMGGCSFWFFFETNPQLSSERTAQQIPSEPPSASSEPPHASELRSASLNSSRNCPMHAQSLLGDTPHIPGPPHASRSLDLQPCPVAHSFLSPVALI